MAIACGTPPSTKIELDAYSWWRRPSEQKAFDAILNIYNSEHADFLATNQANQNNADEVRETLTARLLANAPPSTFQANIGADVLHWSVVDTTGDVKPSSSRIQPLSDFFDKYGLNQNLPTEIQHALMRVSTGAQTVPYTVPVDIHRLNMIYYSTARLTEFRARHDGQSFLVRDVLCPPDVIAKPLLPNDKLDVNIALGTADSFALTLITFESVLPAIGGADLYEDVFTGNTSGEAWKTTVTEALRCVQYLSRSFITGQNYNWAEALAQVEQGQADFSVMGDWSNGELTDALDRGVVDGEPFPGSELVYVFTSDTFPLPVGAPYPDQAEALLGVIASPEGQLAFSRQKGSIPARMDVNLGLLGVRAARAGQDFSSSSVRKVIATSGLFPPYFPGDPLNTKLTLMTGPNGGESEIRDVLQLLIDSQPLFARWQTRLSVVP